MKLKSIYERVMRLREDLDLSSDALKYYKQKYTNFNFSTSADEYGNKQLVIDIPKRRQEVKLYQWQGKINAQVTNGGLSKHNTLEDALGDLYRMYGYDAPKKYGSQGKTR